MPPHVKQNLAVSPILIQFLDASICGEQVMKEINNNEGAVSVSDALLCCTA